jgi:hypothetical protein
MKYFDDIYRCVFVTSVIFVGCYPLYMYWRIYRIYKLAGEQVEGVGFLWFSWYVQSSQSTNSAKILGRLPQPTQAKIAAFQLRNRRIHVGVALWIIFLILFTVLVKRLFD